MVKNSIKIYARLKQENPVNTVSYEIFKTEKSETITFRFGHVGSFPNNNSPFYGFRKYIETKSFDHNLKNYRFEKVFDQNSTQTELFDIIAKPIVNSVIEGFNGTIFAYGQTGSGKTYTITGSSNNYQERGIIPRSIEEIFEFINRAPEKYTTYISYLEIYNEVGYDLLNPKSEISRLEELPKVVLLEDGKGESHIRNLTVQRVSSEQEAMRLLFLGDTNRTITETPMNVYSSRSHCIFTIFINSRSTTSGKIRRSKLNLVDLAGSERVCKSNISGTPLSEAKYINLSLHYLEQVILALSKRKSHVPFRNSMLTYVLKDSLSGNCKTVLLATLNINKENIEETIATCKFAQRVAEINMEALINDEIDPQQEIECLKTEIESLRRQLLQQSKFRVSGNLTKEEKQRWKNVINSYLDDPKEEIPLKNFDMRLIKYSFKLLKDAVKSREDQKAKLLSTETDNQELIQQYKNVIKQKEDEISTLKNLLGSDVKPQLNSNCCFESKTSTSQSSLEQEKENIRQNVDSFTLSPGQKVAFEVFMTNSENTSELDYYTQAIEDIFEIAKKLTAVVEQCQNNILAVRAKYGRCGSHNAISEDIDLELQNQQMLYRNALKKLQELKKKTENLTHGLEKAKMKVFDRFKLWYNNISCGDGVLENVNNNNNKIINHVDNLTPPGINTISRNPEKKLLENTTNACIKKQKSTRRAKSPVSSLVYKYQNQRRPDDSTDTEENFISDSSKCGSRSGTPSRIPRLNKNASRLKKHNPDEHSDKFKNMFEKSSKHKTTNLFTSSNIKRKETEADTSSCETFTKAWPREQHKENIVSNNCNDPECRSRSPSNLEGTNPDNFSSKTIDHPYRSTKMVNFYEGTDSSALTNEFSCTNEKDKEPPEISENTSNFKNKLIQEGQYQVPVDYRNYLGKIRSPYKQSHHSCEPSWKLNEQTNPVRAETGNSDDNRKTNNFPNMQRGPQKPQHMNHNCFSDYNSRTASPKTAPCDNRKFGTVYQMIMGYDNGNAEYRAAPRPYSADSSKMPLYYNRGHPKHRIGVNHTNIGRTPLHPLNKFCNSHYANHYMDGPKKFSNIEASSSDEIVEEQGPEESLWEENSIYTERKQRPYAQSVRFQTTPNTLGLRRNISPQRVNIIHDENRNIASSVYQRQTDYESPCIVNKTRVDSPTNLHDVVTRENVASYNKICNSNLFSSEDSLEFKMFISTIPLTGDSDVDEEIVKFYRTKFV